MPVEPVPEADLRDYLRLLWRRKWMIAGVTVIGVGAALGTAYAQTPTYTGKAQILLQPTVTAAALSSGSNAQLSPTDVQTQIQIVTATPVVAAVAHDLGVSFADAPKASVKEVGTTNVLEIDASDRSPARAAKVANTYANDYISFRRQQDSNAYLSAANTLQARVSALTDQVAALQKGGSSSQLSALTTELATYQSQLDQLQTDASLAPSVVELVTPAVAPTAPSSPRPKLDALLGLVVGLALGVGGAFLIETLDDRIRDPAALEAAAGLPMLGVIPRVATWRDRKSAYVSSIAEPTSAASEAYRQLRTALQFAHLDQVRHVVQITSPSPGEGKSTTAVNLAVALAKGGGRVLLVDADLRRPRTHQFFGLDHNVGLTSVLAGDVPLEAAIHDTGVDGLSVITSGPVPPNPAELLSGTRMANLLERLKEASSVVVIDGPPVLPVTDAVALAARTDAVVLVAQAEKTHRKAVSRSVELLSQVGASITGVVFNAVPVNKRGGYRYGSGYYGRYGYGYGYGHQAAQRGVTGNGAVPQPVRRG